MGSQQNYVVTYHRFKSIKMLTAYLYQKQDRMKVQNRTIQRDCCRKCSTSNSPYCEVESVEIAIYNDTTFCCVTQHRKINKCFTRQCSIPITVIQEYTACCHCSVTDCTWYIQCTLAISRNIMNLVFLNVPNSWMNKYKGIGTPEWNWWIVEWTKENSYTIII